ncbi:MAG: ATP-grasp domain-containing protein [Gemmatimonadota bacterium]
MKRCAFLTLDDPTGFVIDDDLAREPLRELGWVVESVPWRTPAAWDAFDAVVIRSPWDYQDDPSSFLAVLCEIQASGTPVFNRLDLVRWNLQKTYLRDLAALGVSVVPTLWRERIGPGDLAGLFAEIEADEIVVKPVIGANADGAFRLDREEAAIRAGEIEAYYSNRAAMAQPFVRSVLVEGEYSLFYFDGEYSHAIVKTLKAADFRVQEEHGGLIRPIEPGNDLLASGRAVVERLAGLPGSPENPESWAAAPRPPLYARVDLLRPDDGGAFQLMELELIEPALYFRMDPESPGRFARALERREGLARAFPRDIRGEPVESERTTS